MRISLWSLSAPEQRRHRELARELLRRAVFQRAGRDMPIVHELGRAPLVDGLAVSLSRTVDVAMCVASAHGPVGVDVERLRPWEELADIAPLISETPPLDARDLLTLWTRKEALAKAMGVGLPDDVRAMDVPLGPLDPGQWRRRDGWLWIGCPCEDDCVVSLVIGQKGPDGQGPCDVVELEFDEAGTRVWSIQVRS